VDNRCRRYEAALHRKSAGGKSRESLACYRGTKPESILRRTSEDPSRVRWKTPSRPLNLALTWTNAKPLYSCDTPNNPEDSRPAPGGDHSGAIARDLVRPVEANLSTQQSPSQAQAWFPRPHEDARRALDSEEPPRQGPSAAFGLGALRRARVGTPRSLRSSRDFHRVLVQGRRARSGSIVAVVAPNDEAERPARVGLAVRSSGGAVARNRIRRRLRGAYERIDAPMGYDIVVRADDRAGTCEFAGLVDDLEAAVTEAHRGESG
jgi:ribonuclease P protein component